MRVAVDDPHRTRANARQLRSIGRAAERRRAGFAAAAGGGCALLGKVVTLLLAAFALALGMWRTFAMLSGGVRLDAEPDVRAGAGQPRRAAAAGRRAGRAAHPVWVERRRGSAGSRLHVRLVLLFSVVAVTPTIVVAVFATAFFNLGIQAWFNDRSAPR